MSLILPLEDGVKGTHSEFKTIHGRRFYLPDRAESTRRGLQFFVTSRLVRLLSGCLQIGAAKRYVKLNYGLLTNLEFGTVDANQLIIASGSPGPYTKYTILHLDDADFPQCVTKLALSVEASKLVSHEEKSLQYLSKLEGLSGSVPQFIGASRQEGQSWVRQSVCVGKVWSQSLILPILAFLEHLAKQTEVKIEFQDSNAYAVVASRFSALKDCLSHEWLCRVENSIEELRTASVGEMRFVYAHRDLTRWNIKDVRGAPFVYDWEYSEVEYPELYDLLHFLLMPSAIKGNLNNTYIVGEVFPICRAFAPNASDDNDLWWQLLFYFVDLSLFYLESNGGRDEGDRVVQVYGRLIDQILSGRLQ
jgi:hypothetical protein